MIALSTTEAEYITLSQSLRDLLPIMEHVARIKVRGVGVLCTEHYAYFKVCEDKYGALVYLSLLGSQNFAQERSIYT